MQQVGTGNSTRNDGRRRQLSPRGWPGWSTAPSTFVRASPWSASSHCMPHPCRNFISRRLSRARPRRRCDEGRESSRAGAQEQKRHVRSDRFERPDDSVEVSRALACCSYCLPLPRLVPPARQSPCRSALRAACAYDCAYCLMIGRYRSSENIRTRVVHCIRNSPSHSQWEHDTNELVIRMRLGTSNRYTTLLLCMHALKEKARAPKA